MNKRRLCTIVSLVICLLSTTKVATPRDTADHPDDPRPIVAEFFQHIRAGQAEAALQCWNSEVRKGGDTKYEQTQIRNTIAQWIANARLERALQEKLPQVYQSMATAGPVTPTPEQIATAKFTTFRRLAIIRWDDAEDAALPLELDTNAKPPKWLISLSHYRETTRASVGDSFRATDSIARATDRITTDVLAGKVKTDEELTKAQLYYLLDEYQKKAPKPNE